LKGAKCSDLDSYGENKLLTGGEVDFKGGSLVGYDSLDELNGRCKKAQADYIFMFLTFALSAILIGLVFVTKVRGGGNRSVV
jgi:hypothetical protein